MRSFGILGLVLLSVCAAWGEPSVGRHHALRLKPGQDLKAQLTQFLVKQNIQAAAMVTCVGSLTVANLRFADQPGGKIVEGPLEIMSLVGCGGQGKWHLHLAVSDERGVTTGGHLMDGCLVRTTAEIVLVELEELEFQRVLDEQTGYPELEVHKRSYL